jgi:hypothetical protein
MPLPFVGYFVALVNPTMDLSLFGAIFNLFNTIDAS